jgi:hypothetical protein
VLVIASTATNWISAGAAVAAALAAIGVVVLGIKVAQRQGKIEASQLDISKQLRELDEQRFEIERTPLIVVEKSGRELLMAEGFARDPYSVTIRNVGRGAALGIHVQVTIHQSPTSELPGGAIDCDLLMPGEATTRPIVMGGYPQLDGRATVLGWCSDVDGNRHEITPPAPMQPTPNPVAA